jgi:hypothetical protein
VKRKARWFVAGSLLALGLVGCGLYVFPPINVISTPQAWLHDWALEHGHQAYGQKRLRDLLPDVPGRLMRRTDAPQLVIDIGFTEMQALYAKRSEALSAQTLIQGADDFVPASIRHGDRTTRVKLRLKGDYIDHLDTEKWSFRVHVRDDDHIFGLRRFSLQHPKVRGYQGEALFFEYLRRIGLLAPRYFFVHVIVNGNEAGVMAVEEHFSKELLESQSRRDGVIIKFDESLLWQERVTRGIETWLSKRVTSYKNVPIDVFRAGSVAESPALSRDLETATGLLRGIVEGTIAPSEAFDVAQLGLFLAACELWSARHALYWTNLRFYLNPVSLRLEPVAFDALVANRPDTSESVVRQEPIISGLLDDPAVSAAYERGLQDLAEDLLADGLVEQLEAVQEQHLSILQKEYVLLEPFSFDLLEERARFLAGLSEHQLDSPPVTTENYPSLIQAYLITEREGSYVEIASIVPDTVEVVSARWVSEDGQYMEPLEYATEPELPLRLSPTRVNTVPRPQRFPYDAPSRADLNLEFLTRIPGQIGNQATSARPYMPPATHHPISALTSVQRLAAHRFLDIDSSANEIHASPGHWLVEGSLVVPRGFKLVVGPGTTLRFQENAALIALGPIELHGTVEEPIVLEGRTGATGDGTWQGIVALQDSGKSEWSHVEIRDTTGVDRSWWSLTGGVTFHHGEVELRNCTFSGNRGEDALNIIDGKFILEDISILDALSDGLDIDFGEGTVRGGLFRNIGSVGGGDALDVSGAVVDIEGSVFEDIQDKALSVGEQSSVTARNIRIVRAGVGAASKDGSTLELIGATIESTQHAALMAYIKKPVFGSSRIEARELQFRGVEVEARAQTGSRIEIDGKLTATEDLDVEELYRTIMRPRLRK